MKITHNFNFCIPIGMPQNGWNSFFLLFFSFTILEFSIVKQYCIAQVHSIGLVYVPLWVGSIHLSILTHRYVFECGHAILRRRIFECYFEPRYFEPSIFGCYFEPCIFVCYFELCILACYFEAPIFAFLDIDSCLNVVMQFYGYTFLRAILSSTILSRAFLHAVLSHAFCVLF